MSATRFLLAATASIAIASVAAFSTPAAQIQATAQAPAKPLAEIKKDYLRPASVPFPADNPHRGQGPSGRDAVLRSAAFGLQLDFLRQLPQSVSVMG